MLEFVLCFDLTLELSCWFGCFCMWVPFVVSGLVDVFEFLMFVGDLGVCCRTGCVFVLV